VRGYLLIGALLALATALALGWKWQLGMLRSGLFALAAALLAAAALSPAGPWLGLTELTGSLVMWGLTIAVAAAGLLLIFFRDPERQPPGRSDVIVSPADGRVAYVRPVQPGQVPAAHKHGHVHTLAELAGTPFSTQGAVAVGISMNLSDVHVNRAPIAGRVGLLEHVHGSFGSLRDPEMLLRNERVTTVFQDGSLQVATVQIASRLVRRIVSFVAGGDVLTQGQRIGAIRFGSQVDLLLPLGAGLRLAVRPGDHVVAGQTIVALLPAGRVNQAAVFQLPAAAAAPSQNGGPR
jgi:phosphatidylserine decarboxylase